MIRFFHFWFFLVALICSLGLLVVPVQPVSAGMGGYELPGPPWPNYWYLWSGGTVPVFISEKFDENDRKIIWEGLNAWRDQTQQAVQFSEMTEYPPLDDPSQRYVHITTPSEFADLWHLTEEEEKALPTCGSWGPQPEGKPTFTWLTIPNCVNKESVLHEIGHAIGLGHEHERLDRAFYIEFEDPWVSHFDDDVKLVPWPPCTAPGPVGFFDYYSIMHIWPALEHLTPLSADVPLPLRWQNHLGAGDIDMVRALYGFDVHYHSNIIGGDYSSFPVENDPDCTSLQQEGDTWVCKPDPACVVPTQRRCQLACAADVRCKAYTYVGIGLLDTQVYTENNERPYCFLKNDDLIPISPLPEDTNIHSGVRRPDQKCSFGVAFNIDLVGGQISDGVVSMPHNLLNGEDCKELCLKDPDCDAFTFVPGDPIGTCYKKSHNPVPPESPFEYQLHDGYMSGVVRRADEVPATSDAGGPYMQEWASGTTEVALDGTGSSDPEGSPLTYSWTTDCSGGTFDYPASPRPILTLSTSGCFTTCNVSLVVTDDECLPSAGDTATVTIRDTTPPILIGVPAGQTVECDAIPTPAAVTATDTCDTSVVPTFFETRVDGSCAANYTLTRTWTAVDDCGNSAGATQIITVQDTTGPNIHCNDDSFMTPSQAPISFTATATDICGDAAVQITGFDCVGKKDKSKLESCVVTFSGSTITIQDSGGVGNTIIWTVQATDSCGNLTNRTCDTSVVNLPEYREIYE